MMSYYSGAMFGGLGVFIGLVLLVDLILLGIWLYQQINKK